MPEGKCRRWATERRVATVGQNCVWFWGLLSEIPGLSRRLGVPTCASVPVEPGAHVWIGVRAGQQRAGPLASLYINFVSCISYFVLYLYFLSQRAQPIVPTSVEGRVGVLTYVRSLGKFVHTFCILYFTFCIVFVFSITTGPAHCAHVCGRTCGRIDLGSLPWQVCAYILYPVFHILYCICIFYHNGPSPLCPGACTLLLCV